MVQRRLLVSVMIGSIILLMVAACGGTGSQNASQRSENLPSATVSDDRSRNLPQKANETVTATDEYHPSGAIAKSRELKGRSSRLREEASSQFGLYLWPSDEDKYEQIRDRLFANEELASALRGAEREGVTVGLGREFHIGSAKVTIDVDATDQEIIEFLLGE